MDPEQRFLQARQARWSTSTTVSNHRETAEALATFWSALRRRLAEWKQRVQVVSTRQECLNLKEELHALRQACLNPSSSISSSSTTTTSTNNNNNNNNTLPVPMDLPASDWRVLHTEFTRHFHAWEETMATRFPKGKFTFTRYRNEVARRQAMGIPLDAAVVIAGAGEPNHRVGTSAACTTLSDMDETSCVQNVADASLHIHHDGHVVWIRKSHDIDESSGSNNVPLSSGAILLRTIVHCTIQMYVVC
jgi:hypothetical protein